MNENLNSSGDKNTEWKFNSIVCLDLETTGLPQFGPPRITEFALVGIVRSHIKAKSSNILPRVLHKVSFTVYPQKAISWDSSEITGLYNDLLEPIKPWNTSTFQMLLSFLNLLPPPVCLVAHNGYKFDFPIFKKHIQQIEQVLPDYVICVDSLPAFKKILGEYVPRSSVIDQMEEDMGLDNDILVKAAESEAELFGMLTTKQPQVTPDSKTLPQNLHANKKQSNSEKSRDDSCFNVQNSTISKVRKRLFPKEKPVSFKLSDIYSHLFNQSAEGAHNAEGDAMTLMKCVLKIAPEFLKYTNENAKQFDSI